MVENNMVRFLLLLMIVLNSGSISAEKDSSPYIISTKKYIRENPMLHLHH